MGRSQARLDDLSKILFAFTFLWAYGFLNEHMLTWYANLPAEVPALTARLEGGWGPVLWLSLGLGFGVPFVGLLAARARQHAGALLAVSLVVLAGRWLDAWLRVAPALQPSPPIPVFAVGATALLAAVIMLAGLRSGGYHSGG